MGNLKCDKADDADKDTDGDIIHMCRPCFAGNTKINECFPHLNVQTCYRKQTYLFIWPNTVFVL